MHTYIFNVMIQAEVTAPNESDAEEMIGDSFGEGSCAGAEVVNMEILDYAQLA